MLTAAYFQELEKIEKAKIEAKKTLIRQYEISCSRDQLGDEYDGVVLYITSFFKDCLVWYRLYVAYPDAITVSRITPTNSRDSTHFTIIFHEPLYDYDELTDNIGEIIPKDCIFMVDNLEREIQIKNEEYDDLNSKIKEHNRTEKEAMVNVCKSILFFDNLKTSTSCSCETTEELSDECGVEINSDDL